MFILFLLDLLALWLKKPNHRMGRTGMNKNRVPENFLSDVHLVSSCSVVKKNRTTEQEEQERTREIACRKRRRVLRVHAAVAEFIEFAEFKKSCRLTSQNRVSNAPKLRRRRRFGTPKRAFRRRFGTPKRAFRRRIGCKLKKRLHLRAVNSVT